MSVLQNFFKSFKSYLNTTAVFTTFPLSLLLFGLEALIDTQFSCPCGRLWHGELTNLMFAAAPCFAFMLMFLLTRPLKNTNIWCLLCFCTTCPDRNKRCLKSFLLCLIPPLVWVMLLLYDGDYFACGLSDWEGEYVYDEVLQTKWCKPTGKDAERETSLRDLTINHIVISKVSALSCVQLYVIIETWFYVKGFFFFCCFFFAVLNIKHCVNILVIQSILPS